MVFMSNYMLCFSCCLDFSEAFELLSMEFMNKSGNDHNWCKAAIEGFQIYLKSLDNTVMSEVQDASDTFKGPENVVFFYNAW